MTFHLFQYPLPAPAELTDLNAFLATHRIASVAQHILPVAGGSLLVFVVQVVSPGVPSGGSDAGAKIDYRERLSTEEFAVFSRLRDERKLMAAVEGVPVYAVFSNAQLAQMVTARARTLADLERIDGVGKARLEKHAARLLPLLADLPPAPLSTAKPAAT